jgi:acyl dehydratase
MARHKTKPLAFDEVAVGDVWESPARTITETDVVNFAGLTGDYNPLHVDHEFARNTPFGRPIAHGLLGLSFVAGLGSHSPLMRTVAFVRICEWNFLKPIYIGDTVHVRTEITAKELQGRGRRGLVTWKRQLINQTGNVVQEGLSQTLVEVGDRQ